MAWSLHVCCDQWEPVRATVHAPRTVYGSCSCTASNGCASVLLYMYSVQRTVDTAVRQPMNMVHRHCTYTVCALSRIRPLHVPGRQWACAVATVRALGALYSRCTWYWRRFWTGRTLCAIVPARMVTQPLAILRGLVRDNGGSFRTMSEGQPRGSEAGECRQRLQLEREGDASNGLARLRPSASHGVPSDNIAWGTQTLRTLSVCETC